MERAIGTISRGVRAPIIRSGDDIAAITVRSVLDAARSENISIRDRDIIAVTEAVVARAEGNYASVDHIADDIREKYPGGVVGVVFPILSRNRFSICLKGIARGAKKVVLMLSYPSDEVGNCLVDIDALDESGIDPWRDVLSEEKYRELFGYHRHTFTGVDYIEYYRELICAESCEAEIILANDPRAILGYTKHILAADIHSRERTKKRLRAAGAEIVYGLDDILASPAPERGYNEKYGLLGSNKATEETVKLFPRGGDKVVNEIQAGIFKETGRLVEVMVYGDGAFCDPVGKIWELADPVSSPAFTKGLAGQPNEVKLKYLADNNFADLKGAELKEAIADYIRHKGDDLVGDMASQGTTPRRLTDLIGSLSDLTSGSGDKGTPIVWIQGYFDNYATEKGTE